ncbi:ATP-binding cassette domain-containing protein, partial [Citricoccus nitrophenolicus]
MQPEDPVGAARGATDRPNPEPSIQTRPEKETPAMTPDQNPTTAAGAAPTGTAQAGAVTSQGGVADTPDGRITVGKTLPDGEAMLAVRNMKKVYHTDGGDIEAVRNLTFDLPQGQLACLVGPSGSGKTTLLKCIAGL